MTIDQAAPFNNFWSISNLKPIAPAAFIALIMDLTRKSWLTVLEATLQVVILPPHFANVGKRLVKSPKVYFSDVGILCHLTGLKNP